MRTLIWLAGGQDSLGIYTLKQAAEDAYSWNAEAQNDVSAPKNLSIAPTARQLYEATREYVIGCDDGLKTLASRIVLAGIRADMLASGKNDTGVGNQVICVFGSSGAGKTFLVQELARRTNFLFSSFDASTITGEGWAGAKVEDAMKFALNCEPQKASRAIVCYDEVDKVLRSGTSEHRLSVQGEFLRPLGGETIIVGGKRMQDCRPFSYDCRPTCFVFSGVFDGLQELAERGSCRPSIGFHSISGEKRHADFRRALASYGCIDELVNRISCFIGLPDPTANSIARAIVAEHGIVQGYNRILLAHNIVLFPQQSAVSYLSEYGVDSKTFYRGVKHLVGSIVEEILFDGTTGTVMLDAALVRRAIDRQGGNILPETAKPTTPSVERFDEPPAEADLEGISAQKHYRNC
jgi:ATP-dependent protease Clp ATPase subunit